MRRLTECNADRVDDFVGAVEKLCIVRVLMGGTDESHAKGIDWRSLHTDGDSGLGATDSNGQRRCKSDLRVLPGVGGSPAGKGF